MDPSMPQYAALPLASACHWGALSVTAETGSPMEDGGMLVPSFAAVQSSSVTTLFGGSLVPGAGPGSDCPKRKAVQAGNRNTLATDPFI
jgi:hypothetical protein